MMGGEFGAGGGSSVLVTSAKWRGGRTMGKWFGTGEELRRGGFKILRTTLNIIKRLLNSFAQFETSGPEVSRT